MKSQFEMRVAKHPDSDPRVCPARLGRQVAREARGDFALRMCGVYALRRRRWTVMSENEYLAIGFRFRFRLDLCIEPRKVCLMSFVVLFYRPVLDVVKVVNPEADVVVLSWQDV